MLFFLGVGDNQIENFEKSNEECFCGVTLYICCVRKGMKEIIPFLCFINFL